MGEKQEEELRLYKHGMRTVAMVDLVEAEDLVHLAFQLTVDQMEVMVFLPTTMMAVEKARVKQQLNLEKMKVQNTVLAVAVCE